MRVLILVPMLAACAEAPTAQPTWHADVAPLVAERCTGCHVEGGAAPFALDRYADAAPWADAMAASVRARTMPPWGAAPGHQTYVDDVSLDEAQIDTIARWADAGAPEGDPEQAAPLPSPITGGLERVDLVLEMPEPYTPSTDGPDDYRCFALPWPDDAEGWVTGFSAEPGNLASVHHVITFVLPPYTAETVDGFEDWDDAPGYPCFGGPTPDGWTPESLEENLLYSFGGHWAPGSAGTTTAPGTGQQIEPGSRVVLQVHYNTLAEGDLTDQTALHYQLAQEPVRRGWSLPWLDVGWWFAPETMKIPAGQTGVPHTFEGPITRAPALDVTAPGLDPAKPIEVHALFPHMHTLGRTLQLDVRREDGASETLVEIPRWDFSWQRDYQLAEAVRLEPGDALSLTCTFDNDADARARAGMDPEPADVTWGEGTADEMCVTLVYITQAE